MKDDSLEVLIASFRKVMREELSGVRKEMAAHQKDEMAHHKRVAKTLDMAIKVWQTQNKRLSALEARVAELESVRKPT